MTLSLSKPIVCDSHRRRVSIVGVEVVLNTSKLLGILCALLVGIIRYLTSLSVILTSCQQKF